MEGVDCLSPKTWTGIYARRNRWQTAFLSTSKTTKTHKHTHKHTHHVQLYLGIYTHAAFVFTSRNPKHTYTQLKNNQNTHTRHHGGCSLSLKHRRPLCVKQQLTQKRPHNTCKSLSVLPLSRKKLILLTSQLTHQRSPHPSVCHSVQTVDVLYAIEH